MAESALNIAGYILWLDTQREDSDGITNLKMQKLLYYAQGFHLAIADSPAFADDVTAWPHGPVVVPVYEEYKEHGRNLLPLPDGFQPVELREETASIIEEVCDTYGQFSAWRLREMTHQERPWIETNQYHAIPHELMQEFFKVYLRES